MKTSFAALSSGDVKPLYKLDMMASINPPVSTKKINTMYYLHREGIFLAKRR